MSHMKEILLEDTHKDGLSEKDRYFLDILFDSCKGKVRVAMDQAGFPKDMPTSSVTKRLGKLIQERAKDHLVSNTGQAVINLVDVLSDPTLPGSKNIIAAAKEILDRGGVVKEETVNVVQEQNMFLLPPKNSEGSEEEE